MTYRVHLENFEGPLDLLLYFIRRDEIDIYDIPIANITEEFLGTLEEIKKLNINYAGDFIVMAATLMRIKSKILLPRPIIDDEGEIIDPRKELVDQLLEYSNRIKMLIFEFHWIDKNENIFVESVKKLQSKFDIIHIHANNHCQKLKNGFPIVLEITLLNKKYSPSKIEYVDNFPIKGLDFPNNPFLKDIEFSFRD